MAIQNQYLYDTRVEPIVDGLIDLFQKNLVAHTKLLEDAHIGDTRIRVGNTLRFEKGEQVLLMDNKSIWSETSKKGVEFHTIGNKIEESEYLTLVEPLKKDFLINDSARLQKTIKNIPLYPKDIYYGDRGVITWDYVAICIEPESMSPDWIALHGMMSTEYKMAIMVYVRMGSTNDTKNIAARVCHAYADAIHRLLIGEIHVDLLVDDTPLLADANPGDNFVYISSEVAAGWEPDSEIAYAVMDNFNLEAALGLVENPVTPYTPSSSSSVSAEWSSESSSQSSQSSSSTQSSGTSSSSSVSSQSSLISSKDSLSHPSSSSSAQTPNGVKVWLSRPLRYHFRVGDKAVLRRNYRYMYDSRVTNINYGEMQKGELVKAAHISWFGKEVHHLPFSQIGKGGSTY